MNDVRQLIATQKSGVVESDIQATEAKLGAVFPAQYRELFKLVNQAQVGYWTLYPIQDHRNVRKTWDDVVRQSREVRNEAMTEDLVVIGDDGTGDKLCYKVVNGAMRDEVFLWHHEGLKVEEYAVNLREFIMEEATRDDEEDEW